MPISSEEDGRHPLLVECRHDHSLTLHQCRSEEIFNGVWQITTAMGLKIKKWLTNSQFELREAKAPRHTPSRHLQALVGRHWRSKTNASYTGIAAPYLKHLGPFHFIYTPPPPWLTSFSEGARKVVSEGFMRPLPLIFAAFSEGFEEKFVFFCGGKEKSVNFWGGVVSALWSFFP